LINQTRVAMQQTSRLLVIAAATVLFVASCQKNEPEEAAPPPNGGGQEQVVPDEPLTDAENVLWESLPDTIIELEDIILPNGTSVYDFLQEHDSDWLNDPSYRGSRDASDLSPSDQMNMLMSKMLATGRHLVSDVAHTHPEEGPDKPASTGLGYGLGSKRYKVRTRPVDPLAPNSETTCAPDPGCTDKLIYALDCSAMTYWIAYHAGLRFSVNEGSAGSGYLSNPQNWNNALTAAGSDNYDALSYELLSPTPAIADLQSGDVIFKPGHIGVVLGLGSDRWIYQSNGTGYACPTNSQPCTNNNISSRGPRLVKLVPAAVAQLFNGYGVLRVSAGCDGPPTVTDIDGNVYPVVSIGNRCWMAANLKTSRYRDGGTIPNVTDNTAWTQLNSGAWCNYENNAGYDATYGKLYNWYAAANPNICPQGWHVPTDADWTVLTDYLGGSSVAGGKMKAVSPLWNAPNTGATNQSGFSGLPGGLRYFNNGYFSTLGDAGYWWSASESDAELAWLRALDGSGAGVNRFDFNKRLGFCLRCIRD
jgi:uncharacterized protein (TIGR02145 family)